MSFGPELVWAWSVYFKQLASRKVQKVEGTGDQIVLTLSGNVALLLSWGAQSCGVARISDAEKKALLSDVKYTPPIVNALKSYLSGAELVGCEQLRRDRILKFSFKKTVGAGFTASRSLLFEIMERYSNLILLDEDEVVLETAKHIHPADNAFRSVLPGQPYVLPPAFRGVALEDWLAAPAAETTPKIAGFGATLLRTVAKMELADAAKTLSAFYGTFTRTFESQKLGNYITLSPIVLESAEPLEIEPGQTGALTTLAPLLGGNMESRRKLLVEKIAHEIKRREKQSADIEKLLATDGEKLREDAEAIISNLWNIKQGAKKEELSVWDEEGKMRQITVTLDPALSPQQNAAALFAKYKKITASQKRAETLLVKVRLELDELTEQLALAALVNDPLECDLFEQELGLKKKKQAKKKKEEPALPPHKRFDLTYALVFAGLSARGNRYVTFNMATPDDFWFHTQGMPGAHVILRFSIAPGEQQMNDAIDFCASLAAWYSKARSSAKARVDFTKRKYVSAIKGGVANVTYKEFESVTADPAFWKAYLAREE